MRISMDSGSSGGNPVEVRVLFRALFHGERVRELMRLPFSFRLKSPAKSTSWQMVVTAFYPLSLTKPGRDPDAGRREKLTGGK